MVYEVEFRTHGGHPFSITELSAENDAQAIQRAKFLFRCGIGRCFEIRQDGRLVHVEWLGGRGRMDNKALPLDWDRIHACVEQALESVDLQQQRFLMLLAEKFLEGPPTGPAGRAYQLLLIGADHELIADSELNAESDTEAFALASILADACADRCVRFELWCGSALKGAGSCPFHSPSAAGLRERTQRQVVAREVALHDSRQTIAESRELLKKIDKWLQTSLYPAESMVC